MMSPRRAGPGAESDYLSGWKEIAAYLRKGVRTLQRWERSYGLPIHRVGPETQIVLAKRSELDRWLGSRAGSQTEGQVKRLQHCLLWHGRTFPLADGATLLGRATDADVQILLPSVSRRHARIRVKGSDATLEDLDSTHGTWRGALRVNGVVALGSGDEIRLGSAELIYRVVHPDDTTA